MSANAVSASQVQRAEAPAAARWESVSSQAKVFGPVTGSQLGIPQDVFQVDSGHINSSATPLILPDRNRVITWCYRDLRVQRVLPVGHAKALEAARRANNVRSNMAHSRISDEAGA